VYICIIYTHSYKHLFILNDNVTFLQYTDHSLIIISTSVPCSVYKTVGYRGALLMIK